MLVLKCNQISTACLKESWLGKPEENDEFISWLSEGEILISFCDQAFLTSGYLKTICEELSYFKVDSSFFD